MKIEALLWEDSMNGEGPLQRMEVVMSHAKCWMKGR